MRRRAHLLVRPLPLGRRARVVPQPGAQLAASRLELLWRVDGIRHQDGAVEVVELATEGIDPPGVVELVEGEPDELGPSVWLAMVDPPPVLTERPRDLRDDVTPFVLGVEGAVAVAAGGLFGVGGLSGVAAASTFFSASRIWSIFRPACAAIAINIFGVQQSMSSSVARG